MLAAVEVVAEAAEAWRRLTTIDGFECTELKSDASDAMPVTQIFPFGQKSENQSLN
jgi:hypothetical protein